MDNSITQANQNDKQISKSNHGHLAQPPALLVVWINPSGVRCGSA